MTVAMEPPVRSAALRTVGWVLAVVAAASLLFSGYWVPWSHFGTIATGPTDPNVLVRSFNRDWGLSVLIVGAVYAVGLALARRPSPVSTADAPGGAVETQLGLRVLFAVVAVAVLAAAGAAIATFAVLVREVPTTVSVVVLGWAAFLILFVSTSLWGGLGRSLGVALVTAGVVLVPWVAVVTMSVVGTDASEGMARLVSGFGADQSGTQSVLFVSRTVSAIPSVTAGLIVSGLPLLFLPRRRVVPSSAGAVAVGVLLLASSLAMPRVLRVLAVLSPVAPPALASSALTILWIPPPPPPPPPPATLSEFSAIPTAPPPPAVMLPPPAPPVMPVRVGGDVRAPKKIKDASPVMPEIARAAKIEGVVILEITIAADGKVTAAKILRSIPLLDRAAIDAVMQWQYEPPVARGRATALVMTVTVTFKL